MPDNPRNGCPARHLCERMHINMGCGSDICPRYETDLFGDDVPYHLRPDSTPLGRCNRCERQTWSASEVGAEDRMTQPDGNPCGGRIVAT